MLVNLSSSLGLLGIPTILKLSYVHQLVGSYNYYLPTESFSNLKPRGGLVSALLGIRHIFDSLLECVCMSVFVYLYTHI